MDVHLIGEPPTDTDTWHELRKLLFSSINDMAIPAPMLTPTEWVKRNVEISEMLKQEEYDEPEF